MDSGNVRECSSEVMQDVLPPSSVDIEEVSDLPVAGNTDRTTHEKSGECIGEKHFKEGPSKGDHLLDSSFVEPVEGMDIGLSFEENVNTGTNVKVEFSIKKNPTKEKQTSRKKNSSMKRLSYQFQADNEMTLDSRAEMLLPFLDDVKGSNSFKKIAEEIDADACDDILSPDSVSLVDSSESKVVEVELRCGDASTQSVGKYLIVLIVLDLLTSLHGLGEKGLLYYFYESEALFCAENGCHFISSYSIYLLGDIIDFPPFSCPYITYGLRIIWIFFVQCTMLPYRSF